MSNSLIPSNPDEINVFNRPGGTLAKIVTAVGIGAGLYGLYLAAPMILSLFQNLFYASAFLIGLVAMWVLVTSKDFQRNFKIGFSMLMWKITGWFVKMDPIHILQRGVIKMKEKQRIVGQKIDKLQGILKGMERDLEESKKSFQSEQGRLAQFEKRNSDGRMDRQIALSKNKISRCSTRIQNITSRIEQLNKYLKVLKELEGMVAFKVEDTEDQVESMKKDYESALQMKDATTAIKDIMLGFGSSQEDMMAAEVVWGTVNDSLGEIDRFLDGSNDLLINYGADVAAGAAKADEVLKAYSEGGFKALTESRDRIQAAITPGAQVKEKVPVMVNKDNNSANINQFF